MWIRPANSSDVKGLARVSVTSWQAAYRGILPDDQLNTLSVEAAIVRWRQILQQEQRMNLVVVFEAEVVGFVSFGPARDADDDVTTVGEIYGIYLIPEVWRQGIGRSMCQRALTQLQQDGFQETTVWTLKDNVRARRFYEKMDFKLDGGEKMSKIFSLQLPELRYRRFLVAAAGK